MRQLTFAATELPERAARSCPVCGGQSGHLGSRAGLDTYQCTHPSCGLRWSVHDPGAMTPPRKREAGPRQVRPLVNRDRSLGTIQTAPGGGTADAR